MQLPRVNSKIPKHKSPIHKAYLVHRDNAMSQIDQSNRTERYFKRIGKLNMILFRIEHPAININTEPKWCPKMA